MIAQAESEDSGVSCGFLRRGIEYDCYRMQAQPFITDIQEFFP